MSTNKSNRGRNRGRGGHNNTDADGGRPHNNEDLITTVCAATSWPRDDVEKALADNEWNPDLTVDAILAGEYGQRREDWVAVNKKKKQPGGVSDRPRGGSSGASRGGRGHFTNERGEPREGKEAPRGGKGNNKGQKNPAPKTGGGAHTTAGTPATAPTTTAPAVAGTAGEAVKEVAKPVAAAAAPTTNKWASGAPSFEKKETAPAQPAPTPAPAPVQAATQQATHQHNTAPQPVAKPVAETAAAVAQPAPQAAVVKPSDPVKSEASEAKPQSQAQQVQPQAQPQPVARPPVHEEESRPTPAKDHREAAVELPGSVMAEVDPKLRFSVSRPQKEDAKTGPSILNELLHGGAEYPADYQGMMMGGPVPPEMGGYIFPYPVFGAPHFDEQRQQAFGQAASEGNQVDKAGKEGEQMPLPHQPYMPYPYPTMYPPYYPPYGMGQFGGQPQYFHHSMYKQAFSFPPGAVNSGSFEDGSPSMQFYPGFPLSFVPNGQAGGAQPNEAHFEGPDYTFAPHPAIPPMMMQPAPKVPYAGPFGGQGQQRNNNRQ